MTEKYMICFNRRLLVPKIIHFIKTEIIPKNFGRRIAEAEEIRHASDYDDFYIATKAKAEEQIMIAKELMNDLFLKLFRYT